MKNIVGQTPRGKDFFVREKLTRRLYRRLDSGSNLYIAAPRRMGKTAVLRYLEDKSDDAYNAVYVITESIDNSEQFFKVLLNELFKSSAVGKIRKLSNKASGLFDEFQERFKKLSGFGISLELGESKTGFYEELRNLVKKLDDTHGLKVVLMIDEFPQTVENIFRKSGKEEVIRFLQLNREIRQQACSTILFLLTGSIGLPTLAEKLGATQAINDLNIFEIEPFDREEAKELTKNLLDSGKIPYSPESIDYMLEKLSWFSPYHIQLLVQEFADEFDINGKSVNKESVDNAFSKITGRRNDANFAHYYERLSRTFADKELAFALDLLKKLSRQNADMTIAEIKDLAENFSLADQYPFVLRTLEFDGYIFRSVSGGETSYRFTSPILKLWWGQYVV